MCSSLALSGFVYPSMFNTLNQKSNYSTKDFKKAELEAQKKSFGYEIKSKKRT